MSSTRVRSAPRGARSFAVAVLIVAGAASAAPGKATYLTDFVATPAATVPAPEAARVARLVTRSVLRASAKRCKGNGDLTYEVTGGFDGAFTKPGAKERAYVVTTMECVAQGPPVRVQAPTLGIVSLIAPRSRLVIVRGRMAVAKLDVDEQAIVVAKDLDGDGVAELLLAHREAFDGSITARMVTVRGGKLQVIRDFGDVVTACGLASPAMQTTISYTRGDHGLELEAVPKPRVCP